MSRDMGTIETGNVFKYDDAAAIPVIRQHACLQCKLRGKRM